MRYLFLIFYLITALAGQDVPKAAALCTALDGEVTVIRHSAQGLKRTQILDELFPGDSLRTGSNGSATILYNDGKIITINAGLGIAITQPAPDSVRGDRGAEEGGTAVNNPGQLVALIAEGEKIAANLVVRGAEDTLAIAIYEPGNTALLEGKPRIAWGSYGGAQSYLIKIQRMGSDIWSVITVDTALPYPANKPELEPGSYLLRVIALTNENDTLNLTDRSIRVLKPEDAEAVRNSLARIQEQKPDSFTLHLLNAEVYETQKLRIDAIREYETLLEMNPSLPFVHRTLSILYRENGRSKIANQHFDLYQKLTGPG
jgi:tetratricopeptide (TPR) repeat protein